jgi:hypothetical protein
MPSYLVVHVESVKPGEQKGGWLWWIRALIVVVVIPFLLFLGYVGFSLQDYTNDSGSKPLQTWPSGAASLLLAGILAWIALKVRPIGRKHLVLIGLACAALVLSIWRPL